MDRTLNSVVHELKIKPEYFLAVRSGHKKFELRKNDRNFKIGDELILCEWDENGYSGEKVRCRIEYLLKGHDGLGEDYVILGISLIHYGSTYAND
ncbi:MAG: DUF3850 domain-containing protein [Methanomassiliicoccaceae archaeon]|nr:DUF3850 domain-containing protein [Methanomassiliicoccaceae archaeon]